MISDAVREALDAFHGSRTADTRGFSDERLWAAIGHRIGAENLHYAVHDCLAEMADQRVPVPAKDRPRYFQAFLNRHYPKPSKPAGKEVR